MLLFLLYSNEVIKTCLSMSALCCIPPPYGHGTLITSTIIINSWHCTSFTSKWFCLFFIFTDYWSLSLSLSLSSYMFVLWIGRCWWLNMNNSVVFPHIARHNTESSRASHFLNITIHQTFNQHRPGNNGHVTSSNFFEFHCSEPQMSKSSSAWTLPLSSLDRLLAPAHQVCYIFCLWR